jgi:hypothetical protein
MPVGETQKLSGHARYVKGFGDLHSGNVRVLDGRHDTGRAGRRYSRRGIHQRGGEWSTRVPTPWRVGCRAPALHLDTGCRLVDAIEY